MRILFMSAELYPHVKTGGLGDVAAALPLSLKPMADIRYLLPGYREIIAALQNPRKIANISSHGTTACLLFGQLPNGMDAYVIDAPNYYHRSGPYIDQKGNDWPDNHLRFGLFCQIGAELGRLDKSWQPDIIHGNDWHCGLMPAYVAYGRHAKRPATVFTIHNIAYQGLFPAQYLSALGLPKDSFAVNGVEYYGQIGFLKAGIYYADTVTTVSPTYAAEITTADYGHGLEGLLKGSAKKLTGILNGIDTAIWNPADDSYITPYTIATLGNKKANKHALIDEMKLNIKPSSPLLAVVSRLTSQKGIDLVIDAIPDLIQAGCGIVILGQGDKAIEDDLAVTAKKYSGQMTFIKGYDEAMAHRIQAGADMLLVPSLFEPCGLVQIYALKYGTLPVVRMTGGLADTVDDGVTGFTFEKPQSAQLTEAVMRALKTYKKPAGWKKMQQQAMRKNFGWEKAAQKYMELYERFLPAELRKKSA